MSKRQVQGVAHREQAVARVVGSGIQAVITALSGDPYVGATTGAAITEVLEATAREFGERRLAPREEHRVSQTVVYAIRKMRENEEAGLVIRQDDFFEERPDDRSPAEEVTEAVYLATQREVEEKKVEFQSYLLMNIAYRADIDLDTAHALIRIADSLSYLQYCVLIALSDKPSWKLRGQRSDRPIEGAVYYAVTDLALRGVVTPAGITERYGGAFLSQVHMGPMGRLLIELMELHRLDEESVGQIRVAIAALERTDENW